MAKCDMCKKREATRKYPTVKNWLIKICEHCTKNLMLCGAI